jgi:3-ketosteroid 9alpha-monooxygenase subunit B
VTARHRRLRVADVVVETDDARTVVFDVPGDLTGWFRARPGQFVTVRVPMPGGDVARCYSLSGSPGEAPRVTVKRAGPASSWMCDVLAPGDELDVLPPAGLFTPRSVDDDLLLVAAGSGITPVMSILRAVMANGSAHVALVYANRDDASVIFAKQLRLLDIRHPGRLSVVHWLEEERGLPSAGGLRPLLEPFADREVFLCGPAPFMSEVQSALTTVPHGRVHLEKFLSFDDDDPFAESEVVVETTEEATAGTPTIEIEMDGEQHRFTWTPGSTLLEVMLAHGLPAPSSCRSGQCAACTCRVEEGEVRMRHNEVLEPEDLDEGYVLACQADPVSDKLRISYD